MRPLLLTVLLLAAATSLSAQFRPTISLSAGSNISTVRWYNPFELNGQTIPSNEYDETASQSSQKPKARYNSRK